MDVVTVGVAAAALGLFVLAPARLRMPLVLGLVPPTLVAGQLLPVLKAAAFPLMILLAFTAWRHPGWHPPPKVVYLYPVAAIATVCAVLYAVDASTAVLLRLHWVAVTVAVLCVAGTVTDRRSLDVVVHALAAGMAVAVALPLTDVGAAATYGYSARFAPYGVNPNQLSVSLAVAAVVLTAVAYRASSHRLAVLYGGTAVVSGVMILLAASRGGAMLAALGVGLIIAHALRHRPLMAGAAVVAVVVAGWGITTYVPDNRLDRLAVETLTETHERSRFWAEYSEAISERPWTGLAFSHGERAHSLEDLGRSTHNAHLEWAYLTGWPVTLLVVGLAAGSILMLPRLRRRVPPQLLLAFTAVLVGGQIHGAFARHLYYPTHLVAFVHLLVAMIVYTLVARRPATAPQDRYDTGPPAEVDARDR